MNGNYWVNGWAKWYQDAEVQIPQEYSVHTDFMRYGDEDEVREAFAQINGLFMQMFSDIANAPEEFAMPLHERKKYRYFSQQSRDAEHAPLRPIILLHQLLTCGEVRGNSLVVSVEEFKAVQARPQVHSYVPVAFNYYKIFNRKVTNAHVYLKKLTDYGFAFEGLKNGKIAADDITITYPDNTQVLLLLKLLADKSYAINRLQDFINCNFRLLQDGMDAANYGWLEHMADRLHDEVQKEFVYKLDKALLNAGLTLQRGGNDEGAGLKYFRGNNAVSSFDVEASGMGIIKGTAQEKRFTLGLRIRNVDKCLPYLETCPQTVMQMFTKKSSNGCSKKGSGCKHGVAYEYGGERYWRCACCGTAFETNEPRVEDIPHYVRLVELGEKK